MISELNFKYGIPEAVTFLEGQGGFPKVLLRHRSGSEVELYLHGATVTGWRQPPHGELLYLSKKAEFGGNKAIRGGIPLVFPQFGGGPLPSHGFARNHSWEVLESQVKEDGTVSFTLRLTDNIKTREIWPFEFEARYTIALDSKLSTQFSVKNTGSKNFSYQNALHTYFRVKDITKVSVKGLKGLTYLDNLNERKSSKEGSEVLKIDREIDRIYQSAPSSIEIKDDGLKRTIIIERENMPDAVVWNPWKDKTLKLADMEALDFNVLLCVESANFTAPAALAPGESSQSFQTLCVKAL